jgi:hypothetical protein
LRRRIQPISSIANDLSKSRRFFDIKWIEEKA